jgi:hypothetical protein
MGARATLTWLDGPGRAIGRYYLAWASPAYQLPYLARWAHDAGQRGEELSATSYLQAALTDDRLDLPREPVAADPGDLDFRYTLQRPCRPDAELLVMVARRGRDGRWASAYQARGLVPLYEVAASVAAELSRQTRRLLAEDGEGVRALLPDPDRTDRLVEELTGWAVQAQPTSATQRPRTPASPA